LFGILIFWRGDFLFYYYVVCMNDGERMRERERAGGRLGNNNEREREREWQIRGEGMMERPC